MGRYQGTEDKHPNLIPGIILSTTICGMMTCVAVAVWPDTSPPRYESVCVSSSGDLQLTTGPSPGGISIGSGMSLAPVEICDAREVQCVWGADYTGPRRCEGKPEEAAD
jgi:hypothetical protein